MPPYGSLANLELTAGLPRLRRRVRTCARSDELQNVQFLRGVATSTKRRSSRHARAAPGILALGVGFRPLPERTPVSYFLITHQAHLATAGCGKQGFRRPRDDVSRDPGADLRPPASHRGRLRFVSVARMSLVRNQVVFLALPAFTSSEIGAVDSPPCRGAMRRCRSLRRCARGRHPLGETRMRLAAPSRGIWPQARAPDRPFRQFVA